MLCTESNGVWIVLPGNWGSNGILGVYDSLDAAQAAWPGDWTEHDGEWSNGKGPDDEGAMTIERHAVRTRPERATAGEARWEVFVTVEVGPKHADNLTKYDEAGTWRFPADATERQVAAQILREMADDTEAGKLEPAS